MFLLIIGLVFGLSAQEVPTLDIDRDAFQTVAPLRLSDPLVLFETNDATAPQRSIVDIAPDGSGAVYLLDRSNREVLVLDARGRMVRTIGPPDSGRQFRNVASGRGMVAVHDLRHRANRPVDLVHLFNMDGTLLSTSDLPWDIVDIHGTEAGWVVERHLHGSRWDGIGQPVVDTMTLHALDPSTGEAARVLAYPSTVDQYLVAPDTTLTEYQALDPSHAIARDGAIYVNAADGFVIDVYTPGGTLRKRIVGEVDRIPVTDEEFEARLPGLIRDYRQRSLWMAGILEKYGGQMGHADFRPVIRGMVASGGGRLLVRRIDREEAVDRLAAVEPFARVWDLVDVDDGIVGRLTTPPGATVTHFEWPYVYLTFYESPGNPRVRYTIIEPGTEQ